MPLIDIFRALADPSRLRIVQLLREMELSVGEIAQVLGQSQPRVSRHIKVLVDAGLALRRREGSSIFLTPAPSAFAVPLFNLLDAAAGHDGDHWTRADLVRLAAVRAERAAAAERWFAAHAVEWDAIRSLHVPEAEVEAAMAEMLGGVLGRLVDIGTGTGRILELLGPAASQAIGIDRSPEMLRIARVKLDGQPYELRQGDINALQLAEGSADTITLHQVLHFLPAPASAIGECARLLGEGGQLLIVDFAPHEREELRLDHAHARLGFSDQQVAGWLGAAGLQLAETRSLKGRELTIKLWRATRRAAVKVKAA
ncbi:metalloregulator ArsR/SmtB family transcription factor [Sphingomonas sp.]|uniref:ArsR/SmtB family transcription factor n=1 Tax=Sphingomonas sp. TaxID=28214 RepID=UPI00325FA45B